MAKFLIIGQGRIGKPLAQKISQYGKVVAVARRFRQYPAHLPIDFLQKDAANLTLDDVAGSTHIAVIITPTYQAYADKVAAYQASYLAVCQQLANLAALAKTTPDGRAWLAGLSRIVFVSSTAVYGENGGEIITESTPAVPTAATAQVLLAAERALQAGFGDKAIIVRAGGIYHLGSTRLIEQAKAAHHAGVPLHHFTNRIMDSDLVNVLLNILILPTPKPMYLATDGVPVSSFLVLSFIAKTMHYLPPKVLDLPATGKQICANIDGSWLQFADYQAGYKAVMARLLSAS
ncbi:NAD-dependent epimerase/dehydratase family protein [Moraxella sp. ZJ142]|uniref:NAD-dependent epimerase/dehydratase family protein n=1 Tax=Moraxella marmotae TaxID=3344520 RepID=UPI0035D494E0